MWSGIHSEAQTAYIWRLSNVVGGCKSSRIFSFLGSCFTTTDFLKSESSHNQRCTGRTASIRRNTELEKTFHLVLFAACVAGHRGSLFSDWADFIIYVYRQNCGFSHGKCVFQTFWMTISTSEDKKIIHYFVYLEDIIKQIMKSVPEAKGTLLLNLYFSLKFIKLMALLTGFPPSSFRQLHT